MSLINEHFMISNSAGRCLYSECAKKLPIIDYHCHLQARDIQQNWPFKDMTQLWLEGDHYKWRAMHTNGIPEWKITGNASVEDKFEAWAKTVDESFGNPLYHWIHVDIKYYFNVSETLNHKKWRRIMARCNDQLCSDDFLPQALIRRSNAEVIYTTDSPLDDLEYHLQLSKNAHFTVRVLPTFRPDELFDTDPQRFLTFVIRLTNKTGRSILSLSDFLAALEAQVDFFHQAGCRISDSGSQEIHFRKSDAAGQEALFQRRLAGHSLKAEELQVWESALFIALARMYKQRNWAMQIHFGAIRNNTCLMFERVGINSGFDSVGDQSSLAESLNVLLSAMAKNDGWPKTIIYNLNAAYNDVVASIIANFQSGEEGKKSFVQFGSG